MAGRLSAGGCLIEHVRRHNPLRRAGMERTQRVAECSDHDDFHLISAGLDQFRHVTFPRLPADIPGLLGR